MLSVIGGYRCLSGMQTTGSGTARWCLAMQGMDRYFLKEFLSPVYPSDASTPIGKRQLERCKQFEKKKQLLYAAASCVIGDVLVPVVNFFRENGHYYAVSEAVPEGCQTVDQAWRMTTREKKALLYELALGLQRMHAQGIVHADLKPAHIFLFPSEEGWKPRLIDFDSGFLQDSPPQTEKELEGDPVYLSPEMFLRMAGEQAWLGAAADTFAFGAIIHQIWNGNLPEFDHERYRYLYEAVLEGDEIHLELPKAWEKTVRRMLSADPLDRPTDAEITALFAAKRTLASSSVLNGLKQLMKSGE